jgi:MoaA/NifB/PqqE/SkfB family radical SAM enzyme
MIEKLIEKLTRKRKKKMFSVWQIELTTRCSLQCKMCIRRESDQWQDRDIPFEQFKKLLPHLRDVENVVLEGWGESLLYEGLAECVRLVKREGPEVGFVTSGKGLTKDRASQLVQAGVDFIGFSIAGAAPETHGAIRVNSHLSEVLEAIHFVTEERKLRGTDRPKLHLVCLMVKDNITEIPAVPSLAKRVGIDEVVLTNICHTINSWQEEQRVFSWEKTENGYSNILKEAELNAKRLNIRLRRPSLSPVDVPICEENPLRNLYISVDGDVSPCVYLNPPLPSPFKRIFCGKEYWVDQVSFGNLFQEPISPIWECKPYVDFRNRFIQREKESMELYLSFLNEGKLKDVQGLIFSDPPNPCKSCHKILGV